MARILFAPDSFKGSATSQEVSAALSRGWLEVRNNDEIHVIAFADGGEGTLASIAVTQNESQRISVPAQGADGRVRSAEWLLINGDTAVIEMASICGITTIDPLEPLAAHSFGLGQVIASACGDRRVKEIYVAVGGSASTDGGVGALSALGFRFLDSDNCEIALGGGALGHLSKIVKDSVLALPERGVKVLVDVQSPLLGNLGTAHVFAPQKGASPREVLILEKGMAHLLSVADVCDAAGYGAAGGVSFGLSALWGAKIVSGVETISELVGLDRQIEAADCVVTGEGAFDSQSFSGKVVGHVLERAGIFTTPVMIACGVNKNSASTEVISLVDLAHSQEQAMAESDKWLTEAGKVLATRFNH